MNNIGKNIRCIWELIQLRFHNLSMFRIGFFGPFLVDGSLFIIQLLVFQAIYSKVDEIGGWGQGEMIIFIGTFSLINALNMVIYFFGIITIPDKIKNGEMDLYLTKPLSPLLRITFECVNPGSIPLIILSSFIVVYGIHKCNLVVTSMLVFRYLLWVITMTVLYYEVEVIIRSFAFFIVSTNSIGKVEDASLNLCMKLPGVVFYGVYKVVFYCILPYGIMATYPTLCIIGQIKRQQILFGIAIIVIFTGITRCIWNLGLKHYNSVSS